MSFFLVALIAILLVLLAVGVLFANFLVVRR
jgi:hypothetical protein